MKNKLLLTVLLSTLLQTSIALASNSSTPCDESYQNMKVVMGITNNTNHHIRCEISHLNGGWDDDPTSIWLDMDYTESYSGTACKVNGSGDTVSGQIDCYVYYTTDKGVKKLGAKVASMEFSHSCTSHLNTMGDGSCDHSDYDNSNSKCLMDAITPVNQNTSFKCNLTKTQGNYLNENSLTVTASIDEQ